MKKLERLEMKNLKGGNYPEPPGVTCGVVYFAANGSVMDFAYASQDANGKTKPNAQAMASSYNTAHPSDGTHAGWCCDSCSNYYSN